MERAREIALQADGGWQPPPVRDAATVVMVCDSPEGLHIYLQRRVRTMAFAAGMYVFPGGRVDTEDRAAAAEFSAANPQAPGEAEGTDTLSARYAAVREVQEETGHDLVDPMAMAYVAHWVTPEVEDRRYDTRFYAVRLAAEDTVAENSGESDGQRWVRPADALAEYERGQMAMLPPTVAVLRDFADADSAGLDAEAAITRQAGTVIVPLMPAPLPDPDSESGLRWALIDFRTSDEVLAISSPPAGSESGGIHTSLQ